uniref:LEM domain-containing protein n=1 Tax=Mola mola TaxID=94237 RepID=A0A3Q3X2G2_MOLML
MSTVQQVNIRKKTTVGPRATLYFYSAIWLSTVVQWLALSPRSKKVLGSILGQDVSVWSLHVLPVPTWVFSGYSGFLPHSKNIMEVVLTRLKRLSADELRKEFARANVPCGPITATTRATFERKLARILAGPDNSATDSACSSAGIPGSATSAADHVKPMSAAAPTFVATSSNPTDTTSEELDFGYNMGLNPPEEEDVSVKTSSSSSAEVGYSQCGTETPSKQAQVSPTFYYGVCPPLDDVLARNEGAHVYTDKNVVLQKVKMIKGVRFKAFANREDAEKFAKGICDYVSSPNKSTACVSPAKPGLVVSKENMEVDNINRERANSFKSPRTQDLTAKLRKAVEKGDEVAFRELVWNNPRYLIGSGDNPTIVQEGCRYNVMHVASKENQAGIAQLLLDTLEKPDFMRLMYPDDQEVMLQKRICYIVDLYLNTPDKAGFETPLHFACKFGCPDVVNVLCTHPDLDKNRKNKDGQKPCDVICSRKNKTQEVKQKISDYLEGKDTYIISFLFQFVHFFSTADDFRRSWKTPPRDQAQFFHHILKSDPDRGAEKVGRDLAHEKGYPWAEYWEFLDSFVDLSSTEGLHKLEEYLSKRDFSPLTHEETGENETSNRFRTPSPGKPKKFCNSISVGAFLDEGDDISLEEMKNRQNAALSSITSSAASRDGLKGAVGGHEFCILRGADLIETAAEQDLLRSSGGNGHREAWDSYGSFSATDLSSGLNRLTVCHSAQDGKTVEEDSPTKLDRDVLSAIENIEIDPQKYPSIQKWRSTVKSYSVSDMQSWPSPAGVRTRHRLKHQTPGSPVSSLMSPTGRFSPARQFASPDSTLGRYSPASASNIQRIRLKHLNEPHI